MRVVLIGLLLLLSGACVNQQTLTSASPLLLEYDDFGPQVIAHELLGMGWWQWELHGESRPVQYDITVVVYKGAVLQRIKDAYPVNPGLKKDFRYVEYDEAVYYLKSHIDDDIEPTTTATLQSTLHKIQQHFREE